MEYCPRCGREIQPGNLFCTGCGAGLGRPAATQPPLSPQPPAPGPRAPRDRPPRDVPPRRGARWWAGTMGLALLLFVVGLTLTSLVIRSSTASQLAVSTSPPPASSPPASPRQRPTTQQSTPGLTAEQVAAQGLSRLLARSASDRNAVNSAYNDVLSCGSGLTRDAQAFQQAAASRKALLSELGTLPDGSALPAQLVQDLSGAWQASYQADQDLANWAGDENSEGCTSNDTSDSYYQAATGPDNQATADKTAFAGLWDTIAGQYGLATYQQGQL